MKIVSTITTASVAVIIDHFYVRSVITVVHSYPVRVVMHHPCHPRWIRGVSVASSISNAATAAAAMRGRPAALVGRQRARASKSDR